MAAGLGPGLLALALALWPAAVTGQVALEQRPMELTVREGDPGTFQCSMKGGDMGNYFMYWYRQGLQGKEWIFKWEAIVEKSTKSEDVTTTVKTTPLPKIFHMENLEMSSTEQSTSASTTEVMYTDKFDSNVVTILPGEEAEEAVAGTSERVCNSTEPSAQDAEGQRVNMLSMAVLGLRVLLAKSIAFNTLMSIKLFLF